jgi:chromosome segregation ATPase
MGYFGKKKDDNNRDSRLSQRIDNQQSFIETLKSKLERQSEFIDILKEKLDHRNEKIERLISRIESQEEYIQKLKNNLNDTRKELKDEKKDRYLERKEEQQEIRRLEKSKSTDEKGDEGEDETTAAIKRLKDLGYPMNGIRFYADKENKVTVEIDHIFVCNRGVFVIETKNWNAELSGNTDDVSWIYRNSSLEKEVYSPIMQNEKHIKQLKRVAKMENDMKVFSVISFPGNTTFSLSRVEDYFLKPEEIRAYIAKQPVIYTEIQTKDLYKKINDANKPITHAEHIKNVEERRKNN